MAISHCSYLLKTIKTYKTMKKILLSVFAVAALASCIQNETINPQTPIGFGDAYVQNSTKAIYEGTTKVSQFNVWGTVANANDETAPLYEGATVTRGEKNYGEAWECGVKRFWTPDCDYNFYAVVDADEDGVDAADGVPSTIEYTAVPAGDKDLLYGATFKTTKTGLPHPTTGQLVAFTMEHLLSKISFTFTNPASNGDYSYNVTGVTVEGTYASGVYTITHDAANIDGNYKGTWAGDGTASPLSFGAVAATLASSETGAAANSCVIIPGKPALTIKVATETVFGGKVMTTKTHTLTVNTNAQDKDVTFEKNTHYNFAVTLPAPGVEIQLTIGTVEGFVDAPVTNL